METKKADREGNTEIGFSDKIMVPEAISLMNKQDGRRRLFIMNYEVC